MNKELIWLANQCEIDPKRYGSDAALSGAIMSYISGMGKATEVAYSLESLRVARSLINSLIERFELPEEDHEPTN